MISTHILDTSRGNPAEGVTVRLEKQNGGQWTEIGCGKTSSDGRVVFDCPREKGAYRLHFEIEEYFKGLQQESFFLNIAVPFQITDVQRKYHIPLLLNPYGHSTYRGS